MRMWSEGHVVRTQLGQALESSKTGQEHNVIDVALGVSERSSLANRPGTGRQPQRAGEHPYTATGTLSDWMPTGFLLDSYWIPTGFLLDSFIWISFLSTPPVSELLHYNGDLKLCVIIYLVAADHPERGVLMGRKASNNSRRPCGICNVRREQLQVALDHPDACQLTLRYVPSVAVVPATLPPDTLLLFLIPTPSCLPSAPSSGKRKRGKEI